MDTILHFWWIWVLLFSLLVPCIAIYVTKERERCLKLGINEGKKMTWKEGVIGLVCLVSSGLCFLCFLGLIVIPGLRSVGLE